MVYNGTSAEHPFKIGDFRVPRVPLFEGTSMYTSTHYTVDAPIFGGTLREMSFMSSLVAGIARLKLDFMVAFGGVS